MIHGKTKIELYNPKTKIKEIVRSENTFKGENIAKYLNGNGFSLSTTVLSNTNTGAPRSRPLWQTYVGGIFLFRDAIATNSLFMPSTNKMIGNGSYGIVNAEDVPEMGSWNATESSASFNDGITMCYEFNTAQANGTIGSICLTSDTGGYIGYGNANGKSRNSKYNFDRYEYANAVSPPMWTNPSTYTSNPQTVIMNNVVYGFHYLSASTSIRVGKYRLPISSGHILDNLGVEEIMIDMSSLHFGYNGNSLLRTCYSSTGKIYLFRASGTNYSNGDTVYYWEYNTANDTLAEKSFVNNTGSSLSDREGCYAYGKIIWNKPSGLDGKQAFFIIDAETGDLDTTIKLDTFYAYDTWTGGEFGNGMILLDSRTFGVWLYDTQNKVAYKTNAVLNTSNYPGTPWYYDVQMNKFLYTDGISLYITNHPLYLATINNLQSPITKDNSHTMKITYTLTEV